MSIVVCNWLSGHSNLEEYLKLMRNKAQTLFARAADITTEVINAELHPAKKCKSEVHDWMKKANVLKSRMDRIEEEVEQGSSGSDMRTKILKIIKEIEELLDRGAFPNGLIIHDLASSSLPLLTTDMKGQQFENNLRKILSWLMTDEVYKIGVYGVGGVGKTTLATHIHNHLLRAPGISATVYWVTVSQKCTIWELQRKIAKELKLPCHDLEEADEIRRPAILSEALKKKGDNVVVILDDMWDHFPLEKVGLPIGKNGCKLLLMSRSLNVCQRMECKKLVNVETLSEEESWSLFTEKLGSYDDLPLEAKDVARLVARECDGLPLGIIVVAAGMRGIIDVCEWKTTLEDLKDPTRIHEGMVNEVFPSLQLSFSRLNKELQNCFLSCALYPEDYPLESDMLVHYWTMEGYLEKIQSKQKEMEMAHTIYNKLVSACLLDVTKPTYATDPTRKYVKMHDLIRDMAIRILSQRQTVMIKAGMQLKEVPRLQEWTEELTKVSLVSNRITKIPPGMTPRCPNLSSLLLQENLLRTIPDSFFRFLNGLKFLDLSSTLIEMVPNSISYLVKLTSLNLNDCKNLVYIPSLAKLAKLQHLHLNRCYKLENLPQGIEELVNLECLFLQTKDGWTASLSEFITKLSNLQSLELYDGADGIQITEMQQLGRLERLTGFHIRDKGNFNIYIQSEHFHQLTSYQLLLGDRMPIFNNVSLYERSITIVNCPVIEGGPLHLPDNIHFLVFESCDFQLRNLVDALPSFSGLTRLTIFRISQCRGLECIWSVSSCAKPKLENLEDLILYQLPNFRALAIGRVVLPQGSLSNLKKLMVNFCDKMEKLFSPCLLKGQFQHLERIEIAFCKELVVIFGGTESDTDANEERGELNPVILELPKLREFSLTGLPKLASICKTRLICCKNIEKINVYACPELKKWPLAFQVLEDGVPSAPPFLQEIHVSEKDGWWESLTWDNPLLKTSLDPFVHLLRDRGWRVG